jgi:hypothetical protein
MLLPVLRAWIMHYVMARILSKLTLGSGDHLLTLLRYSSVIILMHACKFLMLGFMLDIEVVIIALVILVIPETYVMLVSIILMKASCTPGKVCIDALYVHHTLLTPYLLLECYL